MTIMTERPPDVSLTVYIGIDTHKDTLTTRRSSTHGPACRRPRMPAHLAVVEVFFR
jgi:hypothetical protein